MTRRRSARTTAPLLVLALAALVAMAPPPAHAASAVALEARALVGGRYEAGGWVAVAVTLVNEGSPTDGELLATIGGTTVRRAVEMPAGSRKVVTLYLRPGTFQREIEVVYREPNGQATATASVLVMEQGRRHVAIVGDAEGVLRGHLVGGGDAAVVVPLAPADVPERPEPLGGLAGIVWAGEAGSLSQDQRRALAAWVADGGRLVVLAGADWQARSAAFADLLPLDDISARDDVSLTALATFAGADATPVASGTVAVGSVRDGGRIVLSADDGSPLVSWRAVGAGRVVLVGADLTAPGFRGWDGGAGLWSRLVPAPSAVAAAIGGFPDLQQARASMSQALDTLPALDLPAAEVVLAVLVAYILLIGPISYVVLRRLDRRELAWVTAPLLVVLFTGCSYGVGLAIRGNDTILHQITIVRAAGSVATVETYAGIFSPARSTFDVRVDHDALIERVDPNAGFGEEGAGAAPSLVVDQGVPSRLDDLLLATGFEIVRADGVTTYEPALAVDLRSVGDRVVGSVTNRSGEPIDDVAYVGSSGGAMIGDLDPGETAELDLDLSGFTQSSASDQVYGFVGGTRDDAERRLVATRRNVIDALVGYGGWMPRATVLGDVGGRGPYVIGWRAGEGPMPVAVEGTETRRLTHLVEAIPVRPTIAENTPVSLGPEAMAVTTALEGTAVASGPATVTLGSGRATWTVSLPLEAAGLVPTELEVLASPEPSQAADPGAFAGLWPEEFEVEIHDVAADAWRPLGSLAERTTFDVADPADVIAPNGTVRIRVTSGTEDLGVGMQPLFMTMRVHGEVVP